MDNGWGNNYNGIFPPWNNNMALSYHKYWNYSNIGDIQHLLNARKQYNFPIWLGETGDNSNVWFTEAIGLLESNNIGWDWWTLKKIGANNPVEILSNPQYNQVVQYWNEDGPRPSANDASQGLMKLAEDLRLENTFFHQDVVDAMIRQPFSAKTLPFKLHSIQNQSIVKAGEQTIRVRSAETFAKLPEEARKEFLHACFDPNKGIGYTLARTNMNSCDFSSGSYTYVANNDAALKTFQVKPDEAFKIPFIEKAIAAAGGKLPLYISPWSPPAWMKDNNSMLQGGTEK